MSSYVQIFIGLRDVPESQLVEDVEVATGLVLEPTTTSRRAFRGSDGSRAVVLVPDADDDYDDEPHLPSFVDHPYELVFHTAPKTIESERAFLEETYRRLRDTGRYSLFATLDLHVPIDPD